MADVERTTAHQKTAKVTRAQVKAARGKIATDKRQGKTTPQWIYAVADAKRSR